METRFKIGDKVRGIKADIKGCEGIIVEVREGGYIIKLTKIGNERWHGKGEWQVGELLNRLSFWNGCLIKIGTESSSKNIMSNLNLMQKNHLSPDLKKMIEADLISRDLELTGNGLKALETIMFGEKIKEMVGIANEILKERSK